MKSDIPNLMRERGFDALVVLGGGISNPIMNYVAGPARLMRSVFAMKADGTSILVHNPMERDEARETGLPCVPWTEFGLKKLVEEEKSDIRAEARMIGLILERINAKGKVSFYGNYEASRLLTQIEFLKSRAKDIQVVTEPDRNLFETARITKDEAEIAHMKEIAQNTCDAIAIVRDYLFSCKVSGKNLVQKDGTRLKLGDLRALMRTELIRRGLVERSGTIISMGRDSAVPHTFGNDAEDIRTGETIVMDVFPGEVGGGYCFDITRTYCVGPVPPEVQTIYDHVSEAHRLSIESLKPGSLARVYQDRVCDFFESKGYRTIRQDESIEEGYVHGLGHGIGLEVHEKPRLAGPDTNTDTLVAGSVFTIEPGLYFPSKGIGVRIEDVVYARPDGTFEYFVDFPRELSPMPA